MKKLIGLTLLTSISFLMIGCVSSEPSLPDTPSFKQGQKDGCATATGDYVKDNNAFESDKDYQDGWFYGRKSCNPAQDN